jgi:hypothetical protein
MSELQDDGEYPGPEVFFSDEGSNASQGLASRNANLIPIHSNLLNAQLPPTVTNGTVVNNYRCSWRYIHTYRHTHTHAHTRTHTYIHHRY